MEVFDGAQLSRLKASLARTRDSIVRKISRAFSTRHAIDDEMLENLEEILLSADVGTVTASELVERVREKTRGRRFEKEADVQQLLRESVENIMENELRESASSPGGLSHRKPHVVMIVGVNGVGKTTTIGKLAHLYKSSGKKVLVAAADTFRAAANQQLEIWAKRAGVDIVQAGGSDGKGDPAAVAFDALKAALARKADVMIVDTAGRLHTKTNLMEELMKIKRVLQKQMADAPHETLLVLDASIGQNAIQQAKQFDSAVGITGLVVTKLDGTAKGGVVLAVGRELRIPVKFVGVGEKIDDLQPFDGRAFAQALLGTS